MDWTKIIHAHIFSYLQHLLEFFQEENFKKPPQTVKFDIHAIFRFKDHNSITALTQRIFERIGADIEITLNLRQLEEDIDESISMCNKFIFGNDLLRISSLTIKNGNNYIIESFSKVLYPCKETYFSTSLNFST